MKPTAWPNGATTMKKTRDFAKIQGNDGLQRTSRRRRAHRKQKLSISLNKN